MFEVCDVARCGYLLGLVSRLGIKEERIQAWTIQAHLSVETNTLWSDFRVSSSSLIMTVSDAFFFACPDNHG